MDQRNLELLQKTLDDIKHQNGAEYWYARDLYLLLGYSRWESFLSAVERSKASVRTQGITPEDHFQDVTKMVKIGSNTAREISDIKLTRYACYLIALNGDTRKPEIAFAQAYFITQTRKVEVLEQTMAEIERLGSRDKLKITEKEFADVLYSRGVDGRGIGEIRNAGDSALFGGVTTKEMKAKLGVKSGALADVLPNVTIKAKDLATEITTLNTKKKGLSGKYPIKLEHIKNNEGVRKVLEEAKIRPEELPPEENIKKIEAKHKKEQKTLTAKQNKELKDVFKN